MTSPNTCRADPATVRAVEVARAEYRVANEVFEASELGSDAPWETYPRAAIEEVERAAKKHFDAVVAMVVSHAQNCTCEPLPDVDAAADPCPHCPHDMDMHDPMSCEGDQGACPCTHWPPLFDEDGGGPRA